MPALFFKKMTLEEYLNKNYKEEVALSYDDWLKKQVDFNGNGIVDSGKIYRTNANGRQVWTGAYYKEDNEFKRLQKDPSTYSKWEAYTETILQKNNQKLRQLKAVWESSQAFESGGVQAVDRFSTNNGIVTQYDKEMKNSQTNNYIKYALIGVGIVGLLIIFTTKRGKK